MKTVSDKVVEKIKLFQRQKEERGFDDSDLWGLNSTIAMFLTPRLKAFKHFTKSHPVGMTHEEWQGIIQKMIDGFEAFHYYHIGEEQFITKVEEALELFKKYFLDLWS